MRIYGIAWGLARPGRPEIDWTMRAHGVSLQHAFEMLKAEPLLVVEGNRKVSPERTPEAPMDTSVDAARVL